jgi:hypothetical protein
MICSSASQSMPPARHVLLQPPRVPPWSSRVSLAAPPPMLTSLPRACAWRRRRGGGPHRRPSRGGHRREEGARSRTSPTGDGSGQKSPAPQPPAGEKRWGGEGCTSDLPARELEGSAARLQPARALQELCLPPGGSESRGQRHSGGWAESRKGRSGRRETGGRRRDERGKKDIWALQVGGWYGV